MAPQPRHCRAGHDSDQSTPERPPRLDLGPGVPMVCHATNLLGTLYGSYYAYHHFLVRRAGIFINVASELGGHTVPYYSSYAAAKHGVVGLGDALRQEIELGELEDIHLCTVMPAAHDTPFFDHAANYTGHEIQAPTPLHDPDDVVETLVRLARDPKDEEIVGTDGFAKILLKKVPPGVQERLSARMMHRTQMEQAPPGRNADLSNLRLPTGDYLLMPGQSLAQ
jgi:short-subunit dehydrogenase